jgi:hypothetical protein
MKQNSSREEFFDRVPDDRAHLLEKLVKSSQEIGRIRWLKGKKSHSFVLDIPPATGIYYAYNNGRVLFPLKNFLAKGAPRYYPAYAPFLREIQRIFGFRARADSDFPSFSVEIIAEKCKEFRRALINLKSDLQGRSKDKPQG